jgi:DNA-binding NarL/FixJ family response regulator
VTESSTVDVLIVDDQQPFREAARTLVSLLGGWRVVGEVESGEQAVEAAADTAPGVILMDINLPGISGIEATRRILSDRPDTRVVLLSTYAADDLPADAASCGAAAYVRKEDLTPRRLRDLLD